MGMLRGFLRRAFHDRMARWVLSDLTGSLVMARARIAELEADLAKLREQHQSDPAELRKLADDWAEASTQFGGKDDTEYMQGQAAVFESCAAELRDLLATTTEPPPR